MSEPDWLALLHEIADAADEIALSRFRASDLRVEEKPDLTPVSEADQAIEARVRKIALERHPALSILGEEEGVHEGRDETRLIVDPIDATSNFVRGIPIFATLLAIESEGEVVAGVVSAPALHSRWSAARGQGAFEGRRRLRVSGIGKLAHAQLFHGSVAGLEAKHTPPGLLELAGRTVRQRGLGDFWQHCMVAEGSGEIGVDPIVAAWDVAPLLVLVEEAGGRATSMSGERTIHGRSFVTSNGLLHDEAIAILNGRGS